MYTITTEVASLAPPAGVQAAPRRSRSLKPSHRFFPGEAITILATAGIYFTLARAPRV